MKKNSLFYLLTLVLLISATGVGKAEGSANWKGSTPTNRLSSLYVPGDNTGGNPLRGYDTRGSMMRPSKASNYDPHHRFYVYVKPGEVVYYSFRAESEKNLAWYYDDTADGDTIFYPTGISSRKPITLTGRTSTITNKVDETLYKQYSAGPRAVAGDNGYTHNNVKDMGGYFTNNTKAARAFWVEMNEPGNNGFEITDWDVTVVFNGKKQPGRVYCRYWSTYTNIPSTAGSHNVGFHDDFGFFVPIDNTFTTPKDDYYIKQAKFPGSNAGYAVFFANSTGPNNNKLPNGQPDIENNRKSIKGTSLAGYEYPLFVDMPDESIWKEAINPTVKISATFAKNATATGGEAYFSITVDTPGFIDILIDLDTVAGFSGNDIRIYRYFGTSGIYTIKWDGKDGANQYVPTGTPIKMSSVATFFPVHFPVHDMEQSLGMRLSTVRPAGDPTKELLFWDHSQIYTGKKGKRNTDWWTVPADQSGTFNNNFVQSPAINATGVPAPDNIWWSTGDNGIANNNTMNAYSGSYIDIITNEFDFHWDSSDIKVEKTVSDPNPVIGDEILFTIKVTNQGLNYAKGVTIQDKLPAGYKYVSHFAPMGSEVTQVDLSNTPPETWRPKVTTYNPDSGIWNIHDIPYDAVLKERNSRTLYITAKVIDSGAGTHDNTAIGRLVNPSDDPVSANNESTVKVTPGNTTYAINDVEVTFKNRSINGNVSINDFDYQGDTQKVTSITDGTTTGMTVTNATGRLEIAADGSYTFIPKTDYTGIAVFTYTVTDAPATGSGRTPTTATAELSIKVIETPLLKRNNSVVANNDVNITATGVPIEGDMLHNDFDPDGNNMTVTHVKDKDSNWIPVTSSGTTILTAHGTVTVYSDGQYIYKSTTSGFVGTDTFGYTNCDEGTPSTCDDAVVAIQVLSNSKPNHTFATDDVFTVNKGTTLSNSILINDFDSEGNTQKVTGVKVKTTAGTTQAESVPQMGELTITTADGGIIKMKADGTFTYENPTGFTGSDIFVYTVCDNGKPVVCTEAVVTVNIVDPTAGKVVALDDHATTRAGVSVTRNVLTNDFDAKTNSNTGLTVKTSGTSYQTGIGTLEMASNGTYAYTPATDYTGEATFTYIVKNGVGDEADAAIIITVLPHTNANETYAVDDVFITKINTKLSERNVLANDFDPEKNTQRVTSAKDKNGITKTVSSSNSTLTSFDTPHGVATINGLGAITYEPDTGFVGMDRFEYTITDDHSTKATASAWVTINVSDIKKVTAADDLISTKENNEVTGDVLINDTDEDNRTLKVTSIKGQKGTEPLNTDSVNGNDFTTTQGGNVKIFPNGSYIYKPPTADFTGIDTFDYTVKADTSSHFDEATVTIVVTSVPITNYTYAKPDIYYTGIATTLIVNNSAKGILANDRDPEGDTQRAYGLKKIDEGTYTIIPEGGSGVFTTPSGSKTTLHSDGTFTYVPAPGFSGTDLFEYRVADSGGAFDDETIRIVVGLSSVTPKAKDDINQTSKGIPTNGNLLTNDDPALREVTGAVMVDEDSATVTISPGAQTEIKGIGKIIILPNGNYTFTPDEDYTGSVPTVTYMTTDGTNIAQASLYITVTDKIKTENNPPVANHDTGRGKEGTEITVNPLSNDSDPDAGDTISVTEIRTIITSGGTTPEAISTISDSPSNIYIETTKVGVAYIDTAGKLKFTSVSGFEVNIPFEYTITDNEGSTASSTIIVTVTISDSPAILANDDAKIAKQSVTITGDVRENDVWGGTSPHLSTVKAMMHDGAEYPITIDTETNIPNVGRLTINMNGPYTFVPATNFIGTVPVTYTAVNDEKVSSNATLYLTIIPTSTQDRFWIGKTDNDWQKPNNWQNDNIPNPGDNIIFATEMNNPGNPAINDLHVPSGTQVIIGNLTNESDKVLVVPQATSITVTGRVIGSGTPAESGRILVKAGNETTPNGSLIVIDGSMQDIYGTVELWAQGEEVEKTEWTDVITGSPTSGDKLWSSHSMQHFGIPVASIPASPTFNGSWLLSYNEKQNGSIKSNADGIPISTFYNKWSLLKTTDVLEAFKGYEITQKEPKLYTIAGKLNFSDMPLVLTREAAEVAGATGTNVRYGLGQNIFGNSYTSAINLDNGIEFDAEGLVEQTVYLYRTGSFQKWGEGTAVSTSEPNAGSYIAIPAKVSSAVWDNQIPSLQGFLLKFTDPATTYSTTGATVTLKYNNGGVTSNKKPQLAPQAPLAYLTATLTSNTTVDKAYLFSQQGTSEEFDNGWDGRKYFGTPTAFIYSESPMGAMQVNTSGDLDGKILTIQPNKDTQYVLTLTKSNLENYQNLHLVDLVTRSVVALTGETTTYSFTAEHAAAPAKRFMIVNSRDINLSDGAFNLLDGYLQNNNELIISNLTAKQGRAQLFNSAGTLLLSRRMETSVTRVPVSLQSGVYILCLEADGNQKSVKIFVK